MKNELLGSNDTSFKFKMEILIELSLYNEFQFDENKNSDEIMQLIDFIYKKNCPQLVFHSYCICTGFFFINLCGEKKQVSKVRRGE